jgi:hypothetical protein
MLISQAAAAKRVSVSRQAAQRWKQEDPFPGFYVEVNGVLKINDEHPEWIAREKKMNADRLERKENNKNRSEAQKIAKHIKAVAAGKLMAKNKKPMPRFFRGALRQAVLERDNFTCQRCGKKASDGVIIEVDHIIEFEDGGETVLENGQALCRECNMGKHNKKKIDKELEPEWVSKFEFSKRVGADRDTIAKYVDTGIIEEDPITRKINYKTELKKWNERNGVQQHPAGALEQSPENKQLYVEAEIAVIRKKIATAKSAEEKAKQEEMKTGEMLADLAPMALLKHFFSFSETMIQRIGRRPYEISPDIAALYRGGNDKKAVDKIVRELESIIKTCVKELIEDVRKEGFKVESEIKGGKEE